MKPANRVTMSSLHNALRVIALMPYVVLVSIVALLQFLYFGIGVGRARGTYNVPAPATSGHPMFERHFRVQMNTLEQLVLFLPMLWMFARFISPWWAAGFGVVYIIGRAIYAASYVREPRSRSLGFALTVLPTLAMAVWLSIWAVRALLSGAA